MEAPHIKCNQLLFSLPLSLRRHKHHSRDLLYHLAEVKLQSAGSRMLLLSFVPNQHLHILALLPLLVL
jgi:hypothetical protein